MRQKTKNHHNRGLIDKKFDFFPQSLTHIPRWVHLVQKTRAKNSHAWAPLTETVYCAVCVVFSSQQSAEVGKDKSSQDCLFTNCSYSNFSLNVSDSSPIVGTLYRKCIDRIVPNGRFPNDLFPNVETHTTIVLLGELYGWSLVKMNVRSLEYSNSKIYAHAAPAPFALGETFKGFVALWFIVFLSIESYSF
jgi:hypothetical protein